MIVNKKGRTCAIEDFAVPTDPWTKLKESSNLIISECCKLILKEYKTTHEEVGKVIHWELCKKFRFDHTNKGYVDNPESLPENETHKLL